MSCAAQTPAASVHPQLEVQFHPSDFSSVVAFQNSGLISHTVLFSCLHIAATALLITWG